jgi:hypothetical protein
MVERTSANMVVPAETLRRLVSDIDEEIERQKGKGNNSLARGLERSTASAYANLESKDGEFVPINGSELSKLTAFAPYNARTEKYHDGARSMLEHYGVWE